MDSQVIAAIITGAFGLLSGIAVAKADSIQLNFLSKGRKLKKNWHGFTQRVAAENGKCNLKNQNKCTMCLRQRGRRISGEIQSEVEDSQGKVKTFRYLIKDGVLEGDYFFCNLVSKDEDVHRIRKHLFYVHTSGERLQGVFVGSRASAERIILGFCDMQSD
ncbi:hypothetical protein [Phormidesmis priestleyi]|uniref:hypothetical protein n=1 Tax=Phormidesmis priestleyi TaxID=268141 RepID=UPI00083B22D4|nr:hypothetical protein [Phormidesmis priestleyi]